MDAIHMHISDHSPQSAVVVGGGFIGLEMAEALAKRGLQVHIVEMQDHIMSVLEAEISGFLHEELTAYGVQIHTGVAVSKIDTDSVTLNNGAQIASNMVLLSVGVKPTLSLAQESGLQIGQAGGLVVNEFLQTSDPNIYAAGDMVEITHTVSGQKVRIPLAGPANRQGRIAASNALGIPTPYKGSIGTSVVRVFDAVAGSTGLSLKQAKQLGLPAQSVTVHKEHHTSYYPGSQPVTVLLVFNSTTGVVLGGQTAGFAGADKRLDAIATAVNAGLTLDDLAQTDFAYSPPIGTAMML
jgi:NADPH-dependent 2,4-dienoyl-CoA reductase/sulfur reductase-like enzyme